MLPIYMGELYNLRKKLGLTQQEFADIVGISQSSMARIETGERPLYGVEILTAAIYRTDRH